MAEWVTDAAAATSLAHRVLGERSHPLVVVSTLGIDGRDPEFDPGAIEAAVAGLADVAVLVTGDVSRAFEELLPDKLQVYGGAGRSYPVDIGRDPDWRRSPLRFPGRATTEVLIDDALGHAAAAGLEPSQPATVRREAGVVRMFAAGRAFVELDAGPTVTIRSELLWPGVPIEWTVSVGQRVDGVVDRADRRLDLDRAPLALADLERAFPHRSVTLGLVGSVTTDRAVVRLHPDAPVFELAPIDVTSNPRDDLTFLLSTGDVVPVRVIHLQGGALRLGMSDIDDDEPILPALALTPGGPPWLDESRRPVEPDAPAGPAEQLGDPEPEPASDEEAPPEPSPVPESAPAPVPEPEPTGPERRTMIQQLQFTVEHLKLENARLAGPAAEVAAARKELVAVRLELGESERDRARYREELTRVKRELRSRGRPDPQPAPADSPADRRARWIDDESWVRHELYLGWVERVSPGERAALPLRGDYRISERFAPSLLALDPGLFDKAVKAAVDVLVGRESHHGAHPLRTGDAGNAPAVVRSTDRARCYRAYVEQNVPAARRLHYWKLDDGVIEFSRVVTHDDMDP